MVIVSKPNNDRHFLSFSRKLFLSVISLFLVFAACFIAYQYQREKEYKVELLDMQLQDYNDRLHQELRYLPDSLWTSMLDSYISKHVNKELRVTVVDLHGNVLFDSSQNDSHELDNHIKRPEVQKALKDGKGYDLRRISETTGKTYFYSATAYEGCIIRSALPYNVNLMNNLAADPHYIWFTVIVSLLLISVFYKFTTMSLERFRSISYRYTSACAKPKRRFTLSAKSLSPICKPPAKDWAYSTETKRRYW